MDQAEATGNGKADRLAELVVHLTDCDPEQALALIDEASEAEAEADELEVVARAMVRLRRVRSRPRRSIDLREQAAVAEETRQ